MPSVAALLVATPIWGFALGLPSVEPAPATLSRFAVSAVFALPAPAPRVDGAALAALPEDRLWREKAQWSRALVLSTALAMTTTVVIGAIQFSDEYGFHDRYDATPCAQGTAILDRCGEEVPWQHAVAGGITAGGLIFATLKSFFIDFEDMARLDPDWLVYETTRWIALGMTVTQAIAGILLSNAVRFGWADPARDFDALQAVAIGHLALGTATLGVQIANAILLF